MRGFSLGIPAFARTAANIGGQGGHGLVSESIKSHPQVMATTTSNVEACSENRYPSPLARSVLPPRGPRRSFFSGGVLSGNVIGVKAGTETGRGFAHTRRAGEILFSMGLTCASIGSVITTPRAEKCANPFLSFPSFPQRSSQAACKRTANVPSQVQPLVPSSLMQPTTTRSPARPSVRSQAPTATTQASVTNSIRLTGAFAAPSDLCKRELFGPAGSEGFFRDFNRRSMRACRTGSGRGRTDLRKGEGRTCSTRS